MENKNSRYLKYALGEIILVVIGILIALQINNWNEERKRKDSENAILNQLKNDLKQSQAELKTIQDFYLERARACAYILRSYWSENLQSDSIINLNYTSIPLSSRIYSPVLGTARSLINSGKIDILSSDELKSNIIAYVEKVDYLLKDIDRYEQTYFRKGVGLVKDVLPVSTFTKEEVNRRNRENPKSKFQKQNIELGLDIIPETVSTVPFQSDFNEVFQNVEFYKGYYHLYISHRNIWRTYMEITQTTEKLLDSIEELSVVDYQINLK